MPHKRNPITVEKVCGLSRVVKANAQVAFDNVALWHERDISHSSNERVALADSFIALDHMVLLALVDTGITREAAYAIVQRNSMQVWDDVQQAREGADLKARLAADPECTLSAEQLDAIFDPWSFLGRINVVFDRLEQLSFE